jgi:hypothetical protein
VKRFEPQYSSNEELNRIQQNLQSSLGVLKDLEILDGKLVTADVATTSTSVAHGLGRSYKGFIVVKTVMSDGSTFTGSIYEDPSEDDTIYLKLDTTANVTATVWVF